MHTKIDANKHVKKGNVLISVSFTEIIKYGKILSSVDKSYIYLANKAKIWATIDTIKPTVAAVDNKVTFSTIVFILFFT